MTSILKSKRLFITSDGADITSSGTGTSLVDSSTQIKSLVEGSNISITDNGNSITINALSTQIQVVANFDALPNPTTVNGKFYWCENSQGTSWLPGKIGGTYYNSGLYYSNGTNWEYIDVPYQATQSTIDIGSNNNQFVTALTFSNASKWSTKQNVGNYITALTGDATASGPGSSTITLATILSVLTKGSASKTVTITTDTKGRITALTDQDILITENQVTGLVVDLAGKVVGPSSATNNAIAAYDLTTGKLIKNTLVTIDSNGGITVPGITSSTYSTKKIEYDNTLNQWLMYDNDTNTALNVGYETWFICLNNTGSTIPNGSVVYISGADVTTGVHTIALAKGDVGSTAVGIGITTESIANNTAGKVTQSGLVNGMDTSLLTAGTVYVSATVAGGLTNTAPISPNYRMRVGFVGKVSSTVGTVLVTPSTASVGNGTANQIRAINAAGTSEQFRSTTDFIGITSSTFAAGNDTRFYDDSILIEQALGSVVLAQTMPFRNITTTVSPTSQTVYVTSLYLKNAATITGVKFLQSTKGNYTASNENRIGLYTYSSGTITPVASTVNDGTLWQTASCSTFGSKAFTATYAASAGLYFIVAIYSASATVTAPILGAGPLFGGGSVAADFTNSAKLAGQIVTQTALPGAIAMSTIATTGINPFFELY